MSQLSTNRQIRIYTKKCFRIFGHEKGWKIFISAAIITFLITSVTSNNMFFHYYDTRSGAFALVCACIWIGIFNSIQSICKERDIIKREYRSGLSIRAYVTAHALFEMALCFAESIIVTAIFCVSNTEHFPESGVLFPAALELGITFFLVIYASDLLGLMISCIVKTPNTAMTVMPFVLIIQLVMSGMIFELEGMTATIANLTVSKWGLEAICVTANVDSMEDALYYTIRYESTLEHLIQLWLPLVAFMVIYWLIAILALRRVEKDKR